jgi:TRAP-type mannitol/chloroaromatic compound transport system permease large subunit
MSWGSILVRLLPVIAIVAVVMGGIYLGVFTPTEAGAIGALAAFVVAAVRGRLSFKVVRDVVLETGYISAAILFLFIAAPSFMEPMFDKDVAIGGLPVGVLILAFGGFMMFLGFMAIRRIVDIEV